MRISVVTTTKSEINNIARLAKSLYPFYDNLHQFIIVNAGTPDLDDAAGYYFDFADIIDGNGSTRGEGKNIGVRKSSGDIIVFFDDDVEITRWWLNELKKSLRPSDIVAGYSKNPNGKDLARVPVFVDGQDITYPTCNIAYKKKVFDEVGYFDKTMVTAEDVEFNYRCVKKGFTIGYNPKMVVNHYQRETLRGFAKQSFWNGYGRKQINSRHPELKGEHQHGLSGKNIMRLGFGFLGYTMGDLMNGDRNP